MRWFRATGYKTATLAQWLQGSVPNKHVLLTFDDGYDDLFNELLPLVIEHRYKPVVFLVADRIGSSNLWDQQTGLRARNLLSLGQIREMQKYGVQFGSHTLTHPFLPSISDAELQREVCDSKSRLEDMLGVEITSFAYPFGGVDMRVRSAVATAGYKVAFTTKPGLNWWNDPLTQRRAGVNDYTSLLDFALKLRNGSGFVGSIAARLRSLEQELPTRSLRNLAGSLRRVGHNAFNRYSRERPGKART
jgi:peptidoglycan/xylan/chitin deacetylase (PgdA/CDA1 family)